MKQYLYRWWYLSLAMLLTGCSGLVAKQEAPFNPYVNGPVVVSEAVDIATDLL